jgi:hypothetical protein
MAVGALAEQWNGKTWGLIPSSAGPVSGLSQVSCPSPSFCLGIGFQDSAPPSDQSTEVVQRWNGRRWTVVRTWRNRGGSSAIGIACASRVFCVAIDSLVSFPSHTTLRVERWDGRRWSRIRFPNPAPDWLGSITCRSPVACQAVGGANHVGVASYQWNGRRWTEAPMVNVDQTLSFTGVSCAAPTACTAIAQATSGDSGTFAEVERWNGRSWTYEALAPVGDNSTLSGIACPARSLCVAVGTQYGPLGDAPASPLAEVWRAAKWSVQPTVTPTLSSGAHATGHLASVACTRPTSCFAVGSFTTSTGQERPLIETYR